MTGTDARGWVPVAALMPDDGVDVLCYWLDTDAIETHGIVYCDRGGWFGAFSNRRLDIPPTHWSLLPEPPERSAGNQIIE